MRTISLHYPFSDKMVSPYVFSECFVEISYKITLAGLVLLVWVISF